MLIVVLETSSVFKSLTKIMELGQFQYEIPATTTYCEYYACTQTSLGLYASIIYLPTYLWYEVHYSLLMYIRWQQNGRARVWYRSWGSTNWRVFACLLLTIQQWCSEAATSNQNIKISTAILFLETEQSSRNRNNLLETETIFQKQKQFSQNRNNLLQRNILEWKSS